MSDINKGSDYQRSLSRIEEKIAYRKDMVKKAKRSYNRLEKQTEEKKKTLREDDRTKKDILDRKLESKRKDLHTATEELGDLLDRKISLEDRGEKNYNQIVEQTTNDIIEQLDGKGPFFPGSRGGPGAHKEYPVQESPIEGLKDEEFFDEEARINKNDPERTYRDRRWVEENVGGDWGTESNAMDKDILKEIEKKLKPGKIYEGEVVLIDRYDNAIVSFYGGDIKGIVYRGGKMGLEVGNNKKFVYKRENTKQNRYVFDLSKLGRDIQYIKNNKTKESGKMAA